MSADCRTERLEALLEGALAPAQTDGLQAHLSACAACRHELEWLRAEQTLMDQRRRRLDASADLLWSRVSVRLEPAAPAAVAAPMWARLTSRLRRAAPWAAPTVAASEPVRSHPPARWALGVLAAGMLFLTFSARVGGPTPPAAPLHPGEVADEQNGYSLDPQWMISTLEQRYGACLVATPNAELPCRPESRIPASFGQLR